MVQKTPYILYLITDFFYFSPHLLSLILSPFPSLFSPLVLHLSIHFFPESIEC